MEDHHLKVAEQLAEGFRQLAALITNPQMLKTIDHWEADKAEAEVANRDMPAYLAAKGITIPPHIKVKAGSFHGCVVVNYHEFYCLHYTLGTGWYVSGMSA